ncbi:monocarboxylate transporter 9 [Ixodes scapularis]
MYTFKKHAWHGQDSARSWAVLALAFWVEFISTMAIRSSGVFCVGILDYFHVTREVASVPVTLSMSARFLGAILLGPMCELWSCQRVLLVCTSVASFGIGICYFAPNVAFISCFLGVLHGAHFETELRHRLTGFERGPPDVALRCLVWCRPMSTEGQPSHFALPPLQVLLRGG